MCVVQTMALVCPYSHPRCQCLNTSVSCYDLQEIPPLNTAVNDSHNVFFALEDGNVARIPNNSLPSGLFLIYLVHNPLTNISVHAFDASAATLQSVYISDAQFTGLPTALQKLTSLMDLTIDETTIHDWDTATLKHIAATLETLELRNMGLSSWPNWISDFHLLHHIDLSWNSLNSIPDDAFSSVRETLTALYLSNTGLTHVPQALSILSNLDTLVLDHNNFTDVSEIEKITGSPFAQKLSYLSLETDGLTRMANFSSLTSLKSLSLYNNRISYIPAGSLPASLTSLSLSRNRLSSVPQDFASMPELSHLDLSFNVISGIDPNTFPSHLTELDLRRNNISIITNSTLRSLNLLHVLHLELNPITTLSPSAFSDLISLQTLYLTDSQLTEIPQAFAELSTDIEIYFTSHQPLSCPCPAPQELVKWYTSLAATWLTYVRCSNGQLIPSYLSGGQCGPPTATL